MWPLSPQSGPEPVPSAQGGLAPARLWGGAPGEPRFRVVKLVTLSQFLWLLSLQNSVHWSGLLGGETEAAPAQ